MIEENADVKVSRQRWQYSVKSAIDDPAIIEAELNRMGNQCWERVSFADVVQGFQAGFKPPQSLFTVRGFKEEDYEQIILPNSPR